MSNVVEVEIKISQLLNDLRSGLTWYAKDGQSIQDKYGMENEDIDAIKQHPAFQKPIKVFRIVDDVTKMEELRSDVKPAELPLFSQEEATQHAIEEFEAADQDDIPQVPGPQEENSALDFMSL